jgi:hypothetical protein
MSHKNLKTSADVQSRKPVVAHAGVKSVHTHKKRGRKGHYHPIDVANLPAQKLSDVLPGSPGSGSAPGANGPPTTGSSIGPGGPLGST